MNNFTSCEIIMLKTACSSQIVNIYDLHVKFHLLPSEINTTLKKYSKLDVLEIVNEEQFKVTEFGKLWLFKNRRYFYGNHLDPYWKQIPYNMFDKHEIQDETNKQSLKTSIKNGMYVPKRSLIDKEIMRAGKN